MIVGGRKGGIGTDRGVVRNNGGRLLGTVVVGGGVEMI